MSMEKDEKEPRRPYQKPELRTIDLVAEEVLAAGCKLKNGGAGPAAPCIQGIQACSAEGS